MSDGLNRPRHPLRVAIVGSGPSAFYAAEHLQDEIGPAALVDMYERLPTPFGLVRGGVAPDHQKIKQVTKAYDRVAAHPGFRFFGNVEFGRHLHLDDLERHYHAVIYAVGASSDRRMAIPGEGLAGSHPATAFVGWYNAHPDYRDLRFDLGCERAVVVGNGNVAVDVARILSASPELLAETDIADDALEALAASRVREVVMLGRRGPAEAAFTSKELRELGELEGVDLVVDPAELEQAAGAHGDARVRRNLEILAAHTRPAGARRTLRLRFFASPLALEGRGRVEAAVVGRNALHPDEDGILRARDTGVREVIRTGLVLRAIGYQGVALPGLGFDERRGIIPNQEGRVLDDEGRPRLGHYVVGWIKRGPTGVIGTNKPDARESVAALLADQAAGRLPAPPQPEREAIAALVALRAPQAVSFGDWLAIDRLERARGAASGRPRIKFAGVEEMLAALEGERAQPVGATSASRASTRP